MADESEDDLIHWRVEKLEKNLDRLELSVSTLQKASWMIIGGIGFVQVILPILEKF